MPAVEAMSRLTKDRKFHAGLGPTKARNGVSGATWPGVITWDALGDPDATRRLLTHLTHLGRLVRHGNGTVLSVTVTEHNNQDAWRDREWPGSGHAIRAPYWHRSRHAVA